MQKLETWLAQHLPEILADLNAGATPEALDVFAQTVGCELPEDFRKLYARHNGQKGETAGLFYGMQFLSLEQAAMEWGVWRDLGADPSMGAGVNYESVPAGAIQLQYINLKWLPFSSDYGGNHLGLDLGPGAAGKVGQIINFGRDEHKKFVLAKTLEDFLFWYTSRLEAGEFRISEENYQKALSCPEHPHFFDALATIFTA